MTDINTAFITKVQKIVDARVNARLDALFGAEEEAPEPRARVSRRPRRAAATPARMVAPKRGAAKAAAGPRVSSTVVVDKIIAAVANGANSAGDIIAKTGLTRAQVSVGCRKAVESKRIHKDGERRFTRYATTLTEAKALAKEAKGGGDEDDE